eukprot:TRINITY_DN860_c0_g1_i1.p1 TRINITY_DN860_c0_g1~~TRINITY_DN860_c0_g1_i1.p1  ORF type:complete len:1395 (-),score=158.52 TRINITY_DN860_c0_g1_i1:4121-8305(-)
MHFLISVLNSIQHQSFKPYIKNQHFPDNILVLSLQGQTLSSLYYYYRMLDEGKIKGDSPPPDKTLGARPAKSPYEKSFVSRLFFSYMNEAMYLANERSEKGGSLKGMELFQVFYENSQKMKYTLCLPINLLTSFLISSGRNTKRASLSSSPSCMSQATLYLHKSFCCSSITSLKYILLATNTQYAGPVCLNLLLEFYSDLSMPNYYGYVISSALVGLLIVRSLMINHGNDYVNQSVTTTYASLYTALYKRLLHLIESSKGVIGAGRIINFFTTDSTFVAEMLNMVNNVWVAPMHLIISVVLIYMQVKWVAFICVGMIIIMAILQSLVMGAFIRNRFANQRETDKRTKLLQEFLEGIRIIKYYAWERFAHARVGEIRKREIKEMSTALYLRTLYEFLVIIMPVFTMLIVFSLYATYVGELTVAKVFTVISLFRILQMPIWTFVTAAILLAQSKASMMRIDKFFSLTTASQNMKTLKDDQYPVGKIGIEDGTFAWDTPQTKAACEEFSSTLTARFGPPKKPNGAKSAPEQKEETKDQVGKNYVILKGINVVVEPKEIVAVVGVVGSGKSSLANAMIGEMITLGGKVRYNGTIAFIAQNAWIMNGTLRENIIMDQPYDKEKYERTLTLCELNEDLLTFPKGDLTEIGSKGINLSGGQKQRVAIARAVYSDADIYIIDDCLSALDPHVGKCIFTNVIMGKLADKTRVFVTHGMSYLKDFKDIVVMKEGRIIARGSYADLKANSEEFKHLTLLDKEKHKEVKVSEKSTKNEEKKEEEEVKEEIKESVAEEKKSDEEKKLVKGVDTGKLIEAERQESGRVKWGNYILLFKSSGIFITIVCLVVFCLEQAGTIIIDWWVGIWAGDVLNKSNNYYIGVYAGLSISQGFIVLARGVLYIAFIMSLAKNTQMNLLWAILRAPLQWFDKTPVGRIMNRTCKDQSNIDNDLVWLLQGCVRMALQLIGSVIIVGIVTYYFFIILGVVMFLYVYYYAFSIQAARDSRRIESMAKSPIFVQYEETLDGLSTIRAYRYEPMFCERMIKKVNHCMDAYFMTTRCVRWLNFRVNILSALVVAGAFYLAVYERNSSASIDSNMIGLSLSQSLNVVYIIAMVLNFFGMLDTRMNSIERIMEYIEENPQEKDFDEPKPADSEWPQKGQIELKDMYLRYRKDLPFVIKGLSVKIAPKEKVGIAGRTGSGKSTLTLGLLRIMEPIDPSKDTPVNASGNTNAANGERPSPTTEITIEPKKGTIIIDGQDVTEIGLHILRKNVAIIPQDPVLFSGTIKSNLDPFAESTEEREKEMINVLAKVKLFEKIWVKLVEKPDDKDKKDPAKKPETDTAKKGTVDGEKNLIELKVEDNPAKDAPVPFASLDRAPSTSSQKIVVPDPYYFALNNLKMQEIFNQGPN